MRFCGFAVLPGAVEATGAARLLIVNREPRESDALVAVDCIAELADSRGDLGLTVE